MKHVKVLVAAGLTLYEPCQKSSLIRYEPDVLAKRELIRNQDTEINEGDDGNLE